MTFKKRIMKGERRPKSDLFLNAATYSAEFRFGAVYAAVLL